MPYRFCLPLLLMLVLIAEGALGAWAGARMAIHVADGIAAGDDVRLADAGCEPVATSLVTSAHAGHGDATQVTSDSDCSCAESSGCDCLGLLTMCPLATAVSFVNAYLPVSPDTGLPVLDLPTSKLSRVFRPPIA